MESTDEHIVIVDFGSQYTQLIARRIREFQVHAIILPASASLSEIQAYHPKGLIFSGGPASVMEIDAPQWCETLLQQGIPILGICYGMQVVAQTLGGSVAKADRREFGRAELVVHDDADLFQGLKAASPFPVWMSHGDKIHAMPKGFSMMANTENSPIAAMKMVESHQKIYCLQFHPEVVHTTHGTKILENFVKHICHCQATWTMGSFICSTILVIREQFGDLQVICGLCVVVDWTVAGVLTHQAIGNQLTCVFIDNGLMRKDEARKLEKIFGAYHDFHFKVLDYSELFLKRLANMVDPERKRKTIGRLFIQAFEAEAKKIGDVGFLVQGTLYPDVIESVSFKGPSATIKTHHNVGGLPARMKLQLIEPLRELFKDEVRVVGEELGLPDEMVYRQPFPGPGLAIRILGSVTPERLRILREADDIVGQEIKNFGLYRELWQAFAVLLPIRSVGVMGDQRTYEHVLAIRAVTSVDAMTADWAKLPYELLDMLSNRLINEVKGINRVVYDVSSKPPATIEWE